MQNFSTKYQQTKLNSLLKGSHTMNKSDLSLRYKNSSTMQTNKCDTAN